MVRETATKTSLVSVVQVSLLEQGPKAAFLWQSGVKIKREADHWDSIEREKEITQTQRKGDR
jgi:hypothetical protein